MFNQYIQRTGSSSQDKCKLGKSNGSYTEAAQHQKQLKPFAVAL